jgi:hypothetical protein
VLVLALVPDPAAAFMTRMTSDWEVWVRVRVRVRVKVSVSVNT